MTGVDVNTVLGIALGYLLAAAIRYMQRSRFWAGVQAAAGTLLADPTKTSDPHEAAELALLSKQSHQVDDVARAISPPPPPPSRTTTVDGWGASRSSSSGTTTVTAIEPKGT